MAKSHPVGPYPVNGDQEETDAIANQWAKRMETLSEDLLHGTLSLEDWHSQMQDAIRTSFLQQAIAGSDTPLSMDELKDLQDKILDQYKYLDKFAQDIEDAVVEEGASLDFITSRSALYAKSSESVYWDQAIDLDLPAMPRDGSTECLSNCQCNWNLEYDGQGNVNATWELGEADHCPTCVDRSETWNPLVIPLGKNK